MQAWNRSLTEMKTFVKWLLRRAGFEIRRVPASKALREESPDEAEYRAAIDVVRQNTMVADAGLKSLYDQVCFCDSAAINGAFVECGVWKGGSVGIMAFANLRGSGGRRALHLFDSFEEICEPDSQVDGARAMREVRQFAPNGSTAGRLRPLTGFYDAMGGPGSVEEVRALLEGKIGYPSSALHVHVGWFQDTVPAAAPHIGPIAILRLDGDWYASTKICLDHLASKVVPGGFIVIDDYGTYEGCRKATDEYLNGFARRPYLHRVNDDIRYWMVPFK